MEINEIFDNLFKFFKVNSISDLSLKLGVSQPAISKWKTRNSINAIKKKCRDLGIYDDIFYNKEDITTSYINKYNINNKLFNFKRNTLIYFLFLIQETNINSSNTYYNYQHQKNEENKIINFFKDFRIDFETGNFSSEHNRIKLDEYISHLISNEELDFIFSNKELFIKSLQFTLKETL